MKNIKIKKPIIPTQEDMTLVETLMRMENKIDSIMSRLDKIEEGFRRIVREEMRAAGQNTAEVTMPLLSQSLSIAQQAINLARQGKREESMELLKAYNKRNAAYNKRKSK
jgi:triphosphoribosyl-dephospho-CoA synthetase